MNSRCLTDALPGPWRFTLIPGREAVPDAIQGIDIAAGLDPVECLDLFATAALVIGNDTGLTHLAALTERPDGTCPQVIGLHARHSHAKWTTGRPRGHHRRLRPATPRSKMKSLLRLWHHRRYTRNHTWYLDIGQRRLFVKASPNAGEARQELAGRDMIADIYRVPALHRTGRAGAWTVHVYERSPHVADGLLLVDAIARAEATQNLTLLDRFLDDILVHYRTTILATARCLPGDQAVGKLYRHRAAHGGRLDEYYAKRTPWPLPTGPWWPDGTEIFVNGTRRRPGLPQIIETLRSEIGTSALTGLRSRRATQPISTSPGHRRTDRSGSTTTQPASTRSPTSSPAS